MNPLHLTAANYRTFADLDIDLPSGCVAIAGPNGAGKSSLLNAIDVALFADRGELADLLTIGEDELLLQLEFEHGGELYRVRRRFDGRGKGKTTLDFEHRTTALGAAGWDSLTRETAAATQELIGQTIGLSRTTFRASSFLRQGDGAAFTEASPRDRKAILAEILGLDAWDRLLDQARAELRTHEDALVEARSLIATHQETVSRRPDVEADLTHFRGRVVEFEAALADGEALLEAALAEQAAAGAAAEKVRACRAEVEAAEQAHAHARDLFAAAAQAAQDLDDKQVELAELAADADRVPELEQQAEQLRAAAAAAQDVQAERAGLTAEADQRELARDRLIGQAEQIRIDTERLMAAAAHLDEKIDDAGDCDRCGQKLGAEAAARAAHSYRDEAATLGVKGQRIVDAAREDDAAITALRGQAAAIVVLPVEDPEPVERELRAARAAGEQRASLAERIRQLTETAGRKDDLHEALTTVTEVRAEKLQLLEQAQAATVDETALQGKVARWRIAVQEARALLDGRRGDVVRAETELARIVAAEEAIVAIEERTAAAQARVDLLKLAEKAYGRDGIPALIVESVAIPQLEVEANRILEMMPTSAGVVFRVELRTQRALKTSEALRETLDIAVYEPRGVRAYESYSGGEKARLNIALRIALARLLAHRRGAQSRLLAIDEIEYLDDGGQLALVDVLKSVAGDFERVLVVSHSPALRDAFDATVSIVSDGAWSRVDAGMVEAVAA